MGKCVKQPELSLFNRRKLLIGVKRMVGNNYFIEIKFCIFMAIIAGISEVYKGGIKFISIFLPDI
jgi:hypothetical protein